MQLLMTAFSIIPVTIHVTDVICKIAHSQIWKVLTTYHFQYSASFLEMIENEKITFSDVKNVDQAKFDNERIKSTIKETLSLKLQLKFC